MSGFGVLLQKEVLEAWRTRRLPVVGILFVIIGILSPLTARYLNEILAIALGDQLPVMLPVPTAATAIDQQLKNMGQMGALAAIALAMGSVSGELDRGTAALVLAQPATRPAFLLAKLSGIAIVLGAGVALGVSVAWIYTTILFEPLPVVGWIVLAVLGWLALLAWASLTFLASAAIGSTTAAAGLGFVALIGVSLAAVVPALDRVLPTGLYLPSALIAAGQGERVVTDQLATAIIGTLVIVAGSVIGALAAFRRREL
jgi:ABC-2 type transport system permease protein